MKIALNLLPEDQKKHLREQYIFRSILQEEIYIISIIIIFFFGLFGVHLVLSSEVRLLEQQVKHQENNTQAHEIETAHQLFRDVSKDVDTLYTLSKNHLSWAPLLKKISATVGRDVRIDGIHQKDGQLKIEGVAHTRQDAVELKEAIAEITIGDVKCFSDITIPAKDLVTAVDTHFVLTAMIATECIRGEHQEGDDAGKESSQEDNGTQPAQQISGGQDQASPKELSEGLEANTPQEKKTTPLNIS